MISRPLLILALLFSCTAVHAVEEKSTPKPGLLKRATQWVWPFKKKPAEARRAEPGKAWRKLVASMTITPDPIKLAEVRTFKVILQVANTGRKLVQLDFPTTQRIEILVNDKNGRRVELWSEDQAFQNEPTLVTINPGERLEYVANVATRDLKAGETYVVEGFFPNFDQLRTSRRITPQP